MHMNRSSMPCFQHKETVYTEIRPELWCTGAMSILVIKRGLETTPRGQGLFGIHTT